MSKNFVLLEWMCFSSLFLSFSIPSSRACKGQKSHTTTTDDLIFQTGPTQPSKRSDMTHVYDNHREDAVVVIVVVRDVEAEMEADNGS